MAPFPMTLRVTFDVIHLLQVFTNAIFSERTTLRSLYAISRPSVVCCLSSVCLSVTLMHPTQAVELFGIFFTIR